MSATKLKKKRTKKGRAKVVNKKGNTGRSQTAFHPFWIWQLLRRNSYYIEAVNEFVHSVKHDDSLGLDLVNDKFDPGKDYRHSILYEYYLDFKDRSPCPIKNPTVGNWLREFLPRTDSITYLEDSYFFLFPKTSLFLSRASFLFKDKITAKEYELIALKKFQDKFDGVIGFPLDANVEFPEPEMLVSILKTFPIFSIDRNNIVTDYDVSESKHLLTFAVNLRFSKAKIKDEIIQALMNQISNLKSGEESFAELNDNWGILGRKLFAYDKNMLGISDQEIASDIFDNFSSNNLKQIRSYIHSVKTMISLFNPKL